MQINKSGLWGEVLTARYLRDRGYDILSANYRTRLGEIDIIAQKDNTICFTEVKTRGKNALYEPKEAVDTNKQNRIIATALLYLKNNDCNFQPRFDVCEIILDENFKMISIKYTENAFNT